MPKPKLAQLDVFDFGRQLIETKDLDPVYVMLYNTDITHDKLCDWLIAYFCFYNCGTASWVSDYSRVAGDGYWDRLARAASNADHPRGSERRHFRGGQAIKAVEELRSLGLSPPGLIARISGREGEATLQEVMGRVKKLRGFGDWIAFKVADILDRLGIVKVQFNPADIFNMYSEPRKGADLVWAAYGKAGGHTDYMKVYHLIIRKLGTLKAPPMYERRINIQEVETILCKYKSHTNGHYPVGKDIKEVKHALNQYKQIPTAAKLLAGGAKGGLWTNA